jgi:hypothetical protein
MTDLSAADNRWSPTPTLLEYRDVRYRVPDSGRDGLPTGVCRERRYHLLDTGLGLLTVTRCKIVYARDTGKSKKAIILQQRHVDENTTRKEQDVLHLCS